VERRGEKGTRGFPLRKFLDPQLKSTYHDDGERHCESRDACEEGRRSYESHRSRIHPHPERVRRNSSVDVDEQAADRSTVQSSDKPAGHRTTTGGARVTGVAAPLRASVGARYLRTRAIYSSTRRPRYL